MSRVQSCCSLFRSWTLHISGFPKAAVDEFFTLLSKDLLQKSTTERQNVIVVKGAGSGVRCLGLDTGPVCDLVSLRYSSVK